MFISYTEKKVEIQEAKRRILTLMEVEIVESSFVVPCEGTPNHSIWLSNIDLLYASRMHTPTIFVFRPNGDPNFFSIEIIKPALAKALVHFYPLAGRLGVGGDGRLEIKCSGEGVLFVVARSSATLDSLLDNFTPSKEVRRLLVPPTDSSDRRNMCIVLQVTFFACGGVCLGIAMHHAVMDGLSAFHFINSWSEIARGAEGDIVPPSLDHAPLRARSRPVVAFGHYELKRPQADNNQDRHAVTPKAPRTATARINLRKDQIASLKRSIGGETRRISTFSAVSALAWRCACRARKFDPDQEIRLFMPVNIRNRLTPPLDPHYFGNAVVRKSTSAAAGDIASRPLLSSVDAIAASVAGVDDEYARSFVDSLEQLDDIVGVGVGAWREARDMWVMSWLTLPTHDADFGWGRPAFMGRAELGLCGTVYLLRSPEVDGGITLLTAMEPETVGEFMELLQQELDAIKPVEASP